LKKGNLIFFDEFNVTLHKFRAFDDFTRYLYIRLEPIGAVNNFYQTAFEEVNKNRFAHVPDSARRMF